MMQSITETRPPEIQVESLDEPKSILDLVKETAHKARQIQRENEAKAKLAAINIARQVQNVHQERARVESRATDHALLQTTDVEREEFEEEVSKVSDPSIQAHLRASQQRLWESKKAILDSYKEKGFL
ncbi:MAG: hypothetical protein S4CHLAM20_09400 [Chlamydiia bacterium]|nr:hypothetical protein [Chlamydiia bacterium]